MQRRIKRIPMMCKRHYRQAKLTCKGRLAKWTWAYRLQVPGLTSPSALQLVHSLLLHGYLSVDRLAAMHCATRKGVSRRLNWAGEAGLLNFIPTRPLSSPYQPVSLPIPGGRYIRVAPDGGISIRMRRFTTPIANIAEQLHNLAVVTWKTLAEMNRVLLVYILDAIGFIGDALFADEQPWGLPRATLLVYWLAVWVLILRSPEMTQPWKDAAKWILRHVLNVGSWLLRRLRPSGEVDFQHGYTPDLSDRVTHQYHAVCKCGWISPPCYGIWPIEKAFREHVRTEGGAATVYVARVVCENCAYTGRVKILANMSVGSGTCPHCNHRGDLRAQTEWRWYQRLLKRKVADATGTRPPRV